MIVEVRLLDGFTIAVDGTPTPAGRWSRRDASALVKLLALSSHGRLHRDRVIDTLWPDTTLDVGLPRLHKAAHYARRDLGDRAAVVLKDEVVALFPSAELRVDAVAFEAAANVALSADPPSPTECATALTLAGELLPEDLREPWLDEPRERLRLRVTQLLQHTRRTEGQVLTEFGNAPPPDAVALRQQVLDQSPPLRRSSVTTLVERDTQLQELLLAVRNAVDQQRGVVLLISGDAGAGKSALVAEFRRRLGARVRAVVGGCDDLLAPPSLGPFRDMAEDLPEVAAALDHERLDDTIPALLHAFAAQPSAVVIEDLHWADDATLDAIRYLARRFPSIAGALILTFRETGVEADHPLRQLLGGLVGPAVRRVELPPLSVAAVRRLGAASDAAAVEIHRVTEGNPFFVTEVLAAGGSGVPPTVRDAVLARLGRLSAPARTFVERLSVIPSRAERWLAETLNDGGPAVLVEAERSGMIIGGNAWVAFRHELARRAIESSLTAAERVQADRTVVSALQDHPGVEPSRLVHHAERSGQVDVILEHGPAAAREAARLGSHRQAAEVLRIVLEHGAALPRREFIELSVQRAYSLYLVNQYEAALACAEPAIAAADGHGDPALLADALLVLARVVFFARGPMRARQAAARAVDILEPVDDEARLAAALTELARAHSNLATVGIVGDASEQAETSAERAVEIAQRIGRPDIEASARCYLGDARLARNDPRGRADQLRAIEISGSDTRRETKVRSYVNAAHGAFRSARMDEAEKFVADGLRAAADFDFFAGEYRLRLTGALVRASRGEWDRAVAELRALVDSAGEPGVMAPLARSVLARLLARRGDPQAGAVLADAWADRAVGDDIIVAGPLNVAQVEIGWLDGSLGDLTGDVQRALQTAARAGQVAVQAELCAYLRRAGIDVSPPADAPGPWAATLAGRWREAAAAWTALGERYETAVVLATAPDRAARARGHDMLQRLGASATLAAV